MSPIVAFPVFLGITVVLLGCVVATGLKARLRWHIPLVGGVLVGLGLTIYFAEKLGQLYDLQAAGSITPIHLVLAKVTTVAYLLPLITGILTLRNRSHKRMHLLVALTVLLLTVLTAVTGCLMIYRAPLLSE